MEDERIPIVHSVTVWKMSEGLHLKVNFVPLPVATDLLRPPPSPHRCRSNNYCSCRRIILCEEEVPSFRSACYLQPKYQSSNYFLNEKQPNSGGTLNWRFSTMHGLELEG
ncbi:hypothetical protein TNCV_4747181 [Trichonephila clavipes]|nr:hypothetical protein TNCV_4747181 [Trichonephila clavipes]